MCSSVEPLVIYYEQLCSLRWIYYIEDALLKVMDQMRERERERERDGWMHGLLYNQWIDHNNIVGKR